MRRAQIIGGYPNARTPRRLNNLKVKLARHAAHEPLADGLIRHAMRKRPLLNEIPWIRRHGWMV